MSAPPTAEHRFVAVAFIENFPERELAAAFPEGKPAVEGLRLDLAGGSACYLFPFGAAVFQDTDPERRQEVLRRLASSGLGKSAERVREDFVVQEAPESAIELRAGRLVLDRLTPERAGVVALTVAQSAAMECFESLVEELFRRTTRLVDGLERQGRVPLHTRPLGRFIGEAINTRSEVLSTLHLLDRPDAIWDDAGMDRIYTDLKAEFDLSDRFEALEIKLKAVYEALVLLLDLGRDRRLELLEVAIVALIVVELALSLVGFFGGGP
ncbi:MAG TPA: RMD1 family protein [Thermoanaerobaculia bacterium]|nr:RMD1 family protein [Thermoanaerobaculia bacterium]